VVYECVSTSVWLYISPVSNTRSLGGRAGGRCQVVVLCFVDHLERHPDTQASNVTHTHACRPPRHMSRTPRAQEKGTNGGGESEAQALFVLVSGLKSGSSLTLQVHSSGSLFHLTFCWKVFCGNPATSSRLTARVYKRACLPLRPLARDTMNTLLCGDRCLITVSHHPSFCSCIVCPLKNMREHAYSTFLLNEQPSVRRALPPVGWHKTVLQFPHSTTD
jgi:hypothetical protein